MTVLLNHVWAVVLLVCLAVVAGEICLDLGANTSSVANLEGLDILADTDDLSNDLLLLGDFL